MRQPDRFLVTRAPGDGAIGAAASLGPGGVARRVHAKQGTVVNRLVELPVARHAFGIERRNEAVAMKAAERGAIVLEHALISSLGGNALVARERLEANYVLTRPKSQSIQALLELTNRYPDRFHLYVFKGKSVDASDEAIIQEFETFHPTLLEFADNQRLMWIENYHPSQSMLAFEVDFVSPEDARNDNRFDEWKEQILNLTATCCEEIDTEDAA